MPKDVGPSEKRISNPNVPAEDRRILMQSMGIALLNLGTVSNFRMPKCSMVVRGLLFYITNNL